MADTIETGTQDTTTSEKTTVTDTSTEGAGLDDLNLDDILNADFPDDPIMQGQHKGLPAYNEVLKHLPENGRKLVQNLRSMTTRKTQELAEARRQIEDEKAAIARERAALYSGEFAKQIDQKANEQVDDIDLYSDEGLQKKIEIETAKRLQAMLKPIQEEMAVKEREAALQTFKAEHPDMLSPELKPQIIQLLTDRPELKLEDAYYIAKAKADSAKLKTLETERKTQKDSQKDALLKTAAGTKVDGVKPPRKMSAWEAYQYHRARMTGGQ